MIAVFVDAHLGRLAARVCEEARQREGDRDDEAAGDDLLWRGGALGCGYGIGVTVDLPAFAAAPGVRAVKLRGFDPVEFALLPCGSATALHQEVRELIVARANMLFPAAARAATAARARR